MQFSNHIVFRKIIAGLLLFLFAFIYTEKAFHTHDNKASYPQQQEESTIKNNKTSCPICDFQLTKDAEAPLILFPGKPFVFIQSEFTFQPLNFFSTVDPYSSDRAPPAI